MSKKTRKLIWSMPLVAVLAVAGALAMFVALVPDGAQADHIDPPGSVTELSIEVLARSDIKVSWMDPEGTVDSYRIDTSGDTYVWVSKEPSTTDVMVDANDGTVTYTDSEELVGGDRRYYRVFAMNEAGTGLAPLQDYVKADGIDPTAPGTTQDLTASAAGHNQINLSWSQPADTGHTAITVYCISVSQPGTDFDALSTECTTGDDTDATQLGVINSRLIDDPVGAGTIVVKADGDNVRQSYEHTGLQPDTRYRYRVQALNSVGPAAVASNSVTATTRPAPSGTTTTAADAVRNLRAVVEMASSNSADINLYWNLPADQDPNTDGFIPPVYQVSSATGATVPAENDTAAWSNLDTANGNPTTVYDHQAMSVGGGTDMVHFRVGVQDGTWSVVSLSNDFPDDTTDLQAERPATPARVAGEIASAGNSLEQIILQWDLAPKGVTRPTGYELDFVEGADYVYWESVLPEARSGYARSPIRHGGLKSATEYRYRIFPYKDGVYGLPEQVMATTAPAVAPDTRLNLDVSADGPTKLKLEWDAPRSDGGSDVTGYYIQVSDDMDTDLIFEGTAAGWISVAIVTGTSTPGDGMQDEWETDDADTMEYTYMGLKPGNVRWFRVIALNSVAALLDNGSVPAIGAVVESLGSAVPKYGRTDRASLPAAPNGLVTEQARNSNYKGTSNRGVLLLWNAPDDPKGAALTGYAISRKVGMDGTWDVEWNEIDEPDPRTYETDNELLGEGEMRYYRVAAVNDEGTGPWSNISMYPADTSHMEPPALGNAGVPMAGLTDNNDPGSIQLTWTAGENANVHWVVVVLVDANGDFDVDNSVWTQASAQDSHTVAMQTEGLIHRQLPGHSDCGYARQRRRHHTVEHLAEYPIHLSSVTCQVVGSE